MGKRLTREEFIAKAESVHGKWYDYSKVRYTNNHTKVCIICPIHGEFWQYPSIHMQGRGCLRCGRESLRKMVFGVGINDYPRSTANLLSYRRWCSILERCYSENSLQDSPSYRGCKVCEEWLLFSNFKKWFDANYIKGYHIDKDILVKGNKVYSPETCCFVPNEINTLFTHRKNKRNLPCRITKANGGFVARILTDGQYETKSGFDTAEDAFLWYKEKKEKKIKRIANEWRDKIDPRVYRALCEYQVEIND